MPRPTLIVASACLLASTSARAASVRPFHDLTAAAAAALTPRRRARLPARFRALEVDRAALADVLSRAPAERSAAPPAILALPYPDGSDHSFRVEESSVMAPDLATRFPAIRTFVAKGIDDPAATARLSVTTLGFEAIVLSPAGTIFVEPYRRGDDRHVISYWKVDARRSEPPARCEAHGEIDGRAVARAEPATTPPTASGAQLRVYRLALAATGEYSTAVCAPEPAAVDCAMSALVATLNRVDGIYEREVAIRMVLVAGDDQLVYTDPATDPYSNEAPGLMPDQNQVNVDAVIGSAGYDLAQVFSTAEFGLSGYAVACNSFAKGEGMSSLADPVGDAFDVDFVAHEIGHQLGANHTFNGTTGGCYGNRNTSTAYEPGSGSTIMAYAGNCDAENLQLQDDDTFHAKSFDEIVAYTTTGGGNSCALKVDTGNTPPTVDAGASYTIPRSTPFTLTGAASDPDASAALTYMWEELDLGSESPPNDDVDAVRPIFRSFVPLGVPSRTFPRIADVISHTTTLGESMPTRDRTMTFRLTVRDNQTGGGGVGSATTSVTVDAASGPFAVLQPNTAVSWAAGSTHTVTWDVAGTDAAPVSCAAVTIDLSTDGGNTFATSLVASTPNDGSQPVTMPPSPTSQARVRVRCVGNIFFDVSDVDFTVTAPRPLPFADGFETGTLGDWDSSIP